MTDEELGKAIWKKIGSLKSPSNRQHLRNVHDYQREAEIAYRKRIRQRVVFGEPKASERYTSEELAAMGLVGVYAEGGDE